MFSVLWNTLQSCNMYYRPDSDENPLSVDMLKIAFDQELRMTLYRHWSIIEAINHSPNIACKFRVWTMKGRKKLNEYLADMG